MTPASDVAIDPAANSLAADPGSVPDHAEASATALIDAALALALAARFDEALTLVDSVVAPADPTTRIRLLLARADVLSRRDYVRGRPDGGPVPALVAEAAERAVELGDVVIAWDVERLRLRHAYQRSLRHADGTPWFGPAGRDPDDVESLVSSAHALRASAPDELRRGWADLLVGWINDNVLGDRSAAPGYYLVALEVGRRLDDPLMVFEAQRHLGDHAHDDGHHADAQARWRDSASAAAQAGHVAGVLAQQLLLGVLARDADDEAGAQLLVGEADRWASAIGARSLAHQTEAFLNGVDPTQAPPGTDPE